MALRAGSQQAFQIETDTREQVPQADPCLLQLVSMLTPRSNFLVDGAHQWRLSEHQRSRLPGPTVIVRRRINDAFFFGMAEFWAAREGG